jgi:site-specific DNA recombinase
MTTAAIYVRVSSNHQEDNYSLPSQEEACRRYAAEHGYQVDPTHVYREVHTGVELWERPQLTALREAVRRHKIQAVVVYAIDRLSRDQVHLGVILSEADHAGVAVLFVTEPLDDSPEGQLIWFVRGYAAKVEHLKLVERINRGRMGRAKAGKLIASVRPLYGYRFNDDRSAYVVDDATAPIVRRIFSSVAAGASLRGIVTKLTDDGIPTPTGGARWGRSTIWQMVRNRAYTGEAFAYKWRNRARNEHGQKVTTRELRAESEWVELPEGVIPPLIDQDTFAAVQHRLRINAQQSPRNNYAPEVSLLRGGFAVCGYCGANMHVERSGRAYRYLCGRKNDHHSLCRAHNITTDQLDPAVWQRVSAVLRDPGLIERKLVDLRQHDPTAADLEAIDRQRTAVERKRANFLTQIGDAPTPEVAALMMERVAGLSEELSRLDAERDAVAARRAMWEAERAKLADLTQWCETVSERLDGAGYAIRRAALEYLGVKVKVYGREAHDRFVIEVLALT